MGRSSVEATKARLSSAVRAALAALEARPADLFRCVAPFEGLPAFFGLLFVLGFALAEAE